MRRALNQFAGDVEELVRYPFQIDAGMRAAVEVTIKMSVLAYRDDLDVLVAVFLRQALAAIVADVITVAEMNIGDAVEAFNTLPPKSNYLKNARTSDTKRFGYSVRI